MHLYCRSRRGDWQVEGDLQLLPGGVLLPRLGGGGLSRAGENGKSVFLFSHRDLPFTILNVLLTCSLAGEGRVHHLLCD